MESLTEEDLRATPELPLARIKKIMKLDENVKMISSEVPLLFSKAATMFIEELTLKAWLHTEDAKRKTLQVRFSGVMRVVTFHWMTVVLARCL